MAITRALRELTGSPGVSQSAIATRLLECGLADATQPKVSKWLRGAAPLSIEQMNVIERCYGKPRGWLLHRAGFIDAEALAGAATREQFAVAAESGPDRPTAVRKQRRPRPDPPAE